MTATAGVTYTYDGDGRRVKKSNGTLYWTSIGAAALVETDLSGTVQHEYVFVNGKRVARLDPPSTVFYFFSDHLGSHDVVTNATGTILNESDYGPYGEERVITNSLSPQNYKFTGKERDLESGLDEFGARHYSSALGRFMVPDWAAAPIAVPYAQFGNPQSLNLYSYVVNNGPTLIDPDGHFAGDGQSGPTSDAKHTDVSDMGSIVLLSSWKLPEENNNQQNNNQQAQNPQTVVFSDRANAPPDQSKPGAAADRTVDYQAGKMDKNGNIDSHDIDRDAKITLHEKLDPNSKTSADITKEPQTKTGSYKDYQFVPAGGSYKVLRDWKVNGKDANVLDLTTHKAFRFELTTFDTYAKPPIKTEYTNTAPF